MTDLAARGIDIPYLNHVVHYDYPASMKLFIHRSGRTARAGKSGTAYVLLTPNELPFMVDTNLHVGRKFESDMTKYTEEEKAKLIQEPLVSLYGQINQSKINEYLTKYEYEQGDLFKTMQNAM